MGWTGMYRAPGVSDREFFEKEFPLGLQRDGEVLDCTTIKNVFYAAVRNKADDKVWALVVMMQRGRGDANFHYKELDETMGPADAECPDRILDLLSDTNREYTLEWRRRCREHNAKKAAIPKIKPGMKIRFAYPLSLTNGDTHDTFEFLERSTFRVDGYRVRITSWKSREFEVVT